MVIIPDEASVIRLVGSVRMEISEEWQVGRRYFCKYSMSKITEPEKILVVEPISIRLAPVHQMCMPRLIAVEKVD